MIPKLKTLPTIDELVGASDAPAGARPLTAAEIQHRMRQWSVAQGMALADRQRLGG